MRAAVALAALLLTAALLGPNAAVAVDDTKPTPVPGCPSAKDNATDSVAPNTQSKHDSLEIVNIFAKHDPAKGAEATTVNFTVKNLDTALPQGYTSKHWAAEWNSSGATYFVRAVVDYTGAVAFEWGERIPETVPGTGTLPRYQYGGDTTGKLFEGPDGVVQIVIPADLGGKAGNAMGAILGSANGGFQVIPVAAKTPTRGISYAWDEATVPKWVVGPCGAAATPPGGGPTTPGAENPAPTARQAPGLEFKVSPSRDSKPPFVFRTTGRIIPPSGVRPEDACQGRVSVQVKRGKKTVSNRRTQVEPDCTFDSNLKLRNRKRIGKAKSLRFVVTFQGNKVLLPQKAKPRSVRVR